ncbi:MAG: hypothetical protein ACRYFU_03815, partial [Janthinobacterium lividum]
SASHITEDRSPGLLPYGFHGTTNRSLGLVSAMVSTSMPRLRVLCFSRDRVLGETRRAVLASQYDTVYVGSLDEFAALASGALFDAIVLCHTLSLPERTRCLQIAKASWPSAGIISVTSSPGKRASEFGSVVFGLDGPEALLNSMQQVLKPGLPGLGAS